jgi:hypothetical protein
MPCPGLSMSLNRFTLTLSVGHHDLYKRLGMTDSSSVDNELVSLTPIAASIIGIKRPLGRFDADVWSIVGILT